MDLILIIPPLIASLSWLSAHWQWITGTSSVLAVLGLLYKKGLIGLGNARWDADKCLDREKKNDAAWKKAQQASDERNAYLTERVSHLQSDLERLHALVDYFQARQIANVEQTIHQPTIREVTNSPEGSMQPAIPLTASTAKQ